MRKNEEPQERFRANYQRLKLFLGKRDSKLMAPLKQVDELNVGLDICADERGERLMIDFAGAVDEPHSADAEWRVAQEDLGMSHRRR